jgi:hypothetical protein
MGSVRAAMSNATRAREILFFTAESLFGKIREV